MAEFGKLYEETRGAGADVAALSVDPPEHAEALRREYQLPFPILCDTEHKVVQEWDLYNREEKGGIARAALFLLDRDRRVLFASLAGVTSRVRASDILAYLRGTAEVRQPRKRVVLPTIWEWLRTAWPAVRLALFSPKR